MARTDDHRAANQPAWEVGRERVGVARIGALDEAGTAAERVEMPAAGARHSESLWHARVEDWAPRPPASPVPPGVRRRNSSPAIRWDGRGRAACSSRDRRRTPRGSALPPSHLSARSTSNVVSGFTPRKAAARSLRVVHPSTTAAKRNFMAKSRTKVRFPAPLATRWTRARLISRKIRKIESKSGHPQLRHPGDRFKETRPDTCSAPNQASPRRSRERNRRQVAGRYWGEFR